MDGKGWKAAGQEAAQQNPAVDTELEHGRGWVWAQQSRAHGMENPLDTRRAPSG